jgi:hypothetical protein
MYRPDTIERFLPVTGDTGDFGALMKRDDLPFRVLTPAEFVVLAGELLGQ